jgi:acetyl esterase/lipase
MMTRFGFVRPWALAALIAASAGDPVSAAETGKLLPAEADLILTLNIRQVLADHKDTPVVQNYLEQWRLALAGDVKRLREYYRAHEVLQAAGITEEEFLKRARALKSVSDVLGVDLLQDIDRLTCGFKIGAGAQLVVVLEGRFKEDKVRSGLPEVSGLHFALLDATTLAISSNKKTLEDVLAQHRGKKPAGLSAGTRTLLDRCAKQQVAFLVNNVEGVLNEAAKYLTAEVARKMDGNEVGKAAVNRLIAELRKQGPEIASASLGLSIGPDETRLQFGLVTVKPKTAAEYGATMTRNNLIAALALKAIDHDLARQLADILLRVNVNVTDATLVVRVQIPHAFIQQLGQVARLGIDALSLRITNIPLWGPLKPPPGALEVEEVRDIAYRNGPKADPLRNRLDLYLPRGKKEYPVVVFVHGGSWVIGDNRCCGLYSTVGHFLASQGVGVVMPNYRLSPGVKHPAHIEDVARAVRWAHDNAVRHGGNPDRLYLLGHSAGGHLVSLLATDDTYLKAEGLSLAAIKGVITVSGPYRIPSEPMALSIGGTGAGVFQPGQLYPLRGGGGMPADLPFLGIAFKMDVVGPAFPSDPKERAQASPLSHVRRGLPPFLILSAENDLPYLPGMADEFHQALVRSGCDSRLLKMDKRNHQTIMFNAIAPDDPTARAILDFVKQHDGKK